jgi:hypothetical protein
MSMGSYFRLAAMSFWDLRASFWALIALRDESAELTAPKIPDAAATYGSAAAIGMWVAD